MAEKQFERYKRKILIENFKNFLRLFRKRKMGMVGLCLSISFITMAALAPFIAPHDPIGGAGLYLAEPEAPPEWVAIFPGYRDLPRGTIHWITPNQWSQSIDSGQNYVKIETNDHLTITYENTEPTGGTPVFGSKLTPTAQLTLKSKPIDYPYDPCRTFHILFKINITNHTPYDLKEVNGVPSYVGIRLRFLVNITRANDRKSYILFPAEKKHEWFDKNFIAWEYPFKIYSDHIALLDKNLPGWSPGENLAKRIFAKKGEYHLTFHIQIYDLGYEGQNPKLEVVITPVKLEIKGLLFGLLGTNYQGQDVWSQFLWGSRVSLMVGILVAIVAIAIGTVIGIIAGYKGGVVDQALVFTADTIYLIPTLPLILLVLMIVKTKPPPFPVIYIIVIIIALLGWSGIARQLRAWVLSLRERAFVEAARSVGASDLSIMFKHILPQTVPLLTYYFVLIIPGAIVMEAGLSLLGFGDPFLPSWGKMLNEALLGGAFIKLSWWWIFPPIIGIVFLCLGFVFIGFTLDEILNPRLRKR